MSPTYDYKCECGNKREIFFRSIKEMEEAEQANEIRCPCGLKMTKGITSFSFELKGMDFPSKKNKRPYG